MLSRCGPAVGTLSISSEQRKEGLQSHCMPTQQARVLSTTFQPEVPCRFWLYSSIDGCRSIKQLPDSRRGYDDGDAEAAVCCADRLVLPSRYG